MGSGLFDAPGFDRAERIWGDAIIQDATADYEAEFTPGPRGRFAELGDDATQSLEVNGGTLKKCIHYFLLKRGAIFGHEDLRG
jgi:hypothetical protein